MDFNKYKQTAITLVEFEKLGGSVGILYNIILSKHCQAKRQQWDTKCTLLSKCPPLKQTLDPIPMQSLFAI